LAAEIDGEKRTEEELLGLLYFTISRRKRKDNESYCKCGSLHEVRKNLSLIPYLVEETLRFYAPIQANWSYCDG
jgi:cytochrome P450 family 109